MAEAADRHIQEMEGDFRANLDRVVEFMMSKVVDVNTAVPDRQVQRKKLEEAAAARE